MQYRLEKNGGKEKCVSVFKLSRIQWLLMLSVLLCSFSVSASHFRGGGISWQSAELDGDGLKNDVLITVKTAWRLNGDSIPSISITPALTITTVSNSDVNIGTDYTLRTDVFSVKNLDPNVTYSAYYGSCCRISGLENNSSGNFKIQTNIFMANGNLAPKIDLPIIYEVPKLQSDGVTTLTSFSFDVGATDANADKLRFRVANSDELGGGRKSSRLCH
tara:strand:+ start:5441 stop:6094 length:654 start_codon:yes stop_codon:yes gene_type:complete